MTCCWLLLFLGLSQAPSTASVDRLIADIDSADSTREREAARQVAVLGADGVAAAPALDRALRREAKGLGEPDVRVDWAAIDDIINALLALGKVSLPILRDTFANSWCDPEAVPIPEKCLDDDAWLRLKALDALSEMGEAAAPTLEALLRDSNPWVRGWAASGLGTVGPAAASAAPQLRELLADPDDHVRFEAELALRQIEKE